MASNQTHRSQDSPVLPGATTKLAGLMAAAAVVLLLVLSMGMTKAGAADDKYTDCIVTGDCVDVSVTLVQGETVQLVFHSFEPGTEVTLVVYVDINGDGVLDPVVLHATADEFGDVVFEWDIPAGVAGDFEYTVEGIDDVTGEVVRSRGALHVEETDALTIPNNGGGGPLPYTGSNSTNLVRIGLVLIVAGGISVVAVRRRNTHVDA